MKHKIIAILGGFEPDDTYTERALVIDDLDIYILSLLHFISPRRHLTSIIFREVTYPRPILF